MKQQNIEKFLTKVDRISAWVLMVAFILYMISGYGLTRGLIDISWAKVLHVQWLPLIVILSFTLHVGLALRLTMMRWQIWNKFSKVVLILGCVLFLVFFGYVELFYNKGPVIPATTPSDESLSEESRQATGEEEIIGYQIDEELETETIDQSLEAESLPLFTLEDLSYYDGQEGRPAYVAVDGIIYDNSEIFSNGRHYSHLAGKDLSEDFFSYHVLEEITKYPVVGRLAD